MYQSIPGIFFVRVFYVKNDISSIKKVILHEYNFPRNFINITLKREELVIGISLPTQREERWVKDKNFMESYAKEKGFTVKVENADTDVAKQASQVESLISQGIDILILAPTDFVAAVDMVKKAHRAGIKVIAYDRRIDNSDLNLYISFNNRKIGEL